MKNVSEKLGWNQKIGVMICAMASAIITGYVPNFITLYYTDYVGLSIGVLGSILMITKITDGFTDIAMGMIIDRTKSKIGRARPWVMAGGFGAAISMFLLFNVPENLSTMGKIIFCSAFYFLVNPFFGTMISVACGTLNNLVTADSKFRSVVGVFSSYGSLIPSLAVGLVVPMILSKMGENQKTYNIVTLIFAGFTILAAVVGALMVRETVTERSIENLSERQAIKDSLIELAQNKYFIYLALGTIFFNLSAVPAATYYAKYIFNDVGMATIMNLPGLLMIFLLPFAVPVVNKFGKRNCVVGGMLISAVSHLIVFFANDNIIIFMAAKIIATFGTVAFFVALIPITGEICDYALYKTKKPMDGTISAAASMGGKIGMGLAAGLSGLIMSLGGYVGTAVIQTPTALMTIRGLMGIYPAIVFTLAAICFSKIDLEKKNIIEIQAELREQGLR